MDKKEILQRLKTSRDIHAISDSQNWKDAFALYRKDTGEDLSMKCRMCFQKVIKWLEA